MQEAKDTVGGNMSNNRQGEESISTSEPSGHPIYGTAKDEHWVYPDDINAYDEEAARLLCGYID